MAFYENEFNFLIKCFALLQGGKTFQANVRSLIYSHWLTDSVRGLSSVSRGFSWIQCYLVVIVSQFSLFAFIFRGSAHSSGPPNARESLDNFQYK